MRIGINASFLRKPGTGIGQVTVNFLRKLTEYSVSGFTYQGNTKYMIHDTEYILYTEEPADLKLSDNFKVKSFLPRWWKRDDILRQWLWERQVAKEAMKDNCDVFLSLYQSSTQFPISNFQFRISPHMRHVMVVHDIIPVLFPEYVRKFSQRLHWRAVKKAIFQTDAIIAISESTKRDLMRLGIGEEKITLAYPDAAPIFHERIPEDTVSTVLQKYSLKPGYIYHGGGLEIRKNTERLLRAYAALCARNQESGIRNQESAVIPSLVISGKIFDPSNKLATDVVGLIRKLYLAGTVRLLGFVPDEDLPALYRGALFFVYPSLYEGFGLPVLEALCQGVPVLTSRSSALPEVGGKAAIYVDPTATEALTLQMKRMLTDETLRVALISESASQAAKFNWEYFVRKILATLIQ